MSMNMSMHLRTIPSQVLSSRQIQSLEILEMGTQELQDYVNAFAQENPVFEARDRENAFENDAYLTSSEWTRTQDIFNRSDVSVNSGEQGDPLFNIAQADCGVTLYDELIGQLRDLKTERPLLAAARFIIGCLDEKGYLSEEDRQLAAASGFTVKEIRAALKAVQSLEPAGVGARDLSECLCLQLKRLPGDTRLAQTIAQRYLPQLAARQYGRIATNTHCSELEVRQAADLIRSLDPKPGLVFSGQQPLQYIRPDVIISKVHEDLNISVNDWYFPQIQINGQYAAMLRNTEDEEVRTYLEEKLNSARRLINCLAQRRNTLIRCVEILLESQKEFFYKGSAALKPLNMSLVAQRMDLHVSTISRTLKNKYLQCDFGIYPLSYFFLRKLAGTADISGNRVRQLIAEMITREDRGRPFSDREIAEHLAGSGIEISRRTVAKYRSELHILGAAQRRVVSRYASNSSPKGSPSDHKIKL